jgi:hypothetical protein
MSDSFSDGPRVGILQANMRGTGGGRGFPFVIRTELAHIRTIEGTRSSLLGSHPFGRIMRWVRWQPFAVGWTKWAGRGRHECGQNRGRTVMLRRMLRRLAG